MIYTIAKTLAPNIEILTHVDRFGGLTIPVTRPITLQGETQGYNTFPVSCKPTGAQWLVGTAYLKGDIVLNDSTYYIATVDNTGQEPPDASYWRVYTGIDCTEDARYKNLVPNSKFRSILFFEDNNGAQFQRIESPKGGIYVWGFNLRLIGWLNLALLGGSGCEYAGAFALQIIQILMDNQGKHDLLTSGLSGGVDIIPVARVEVKSISQAPKNQNIFSKYTFTKEREQGLFLYPYDYFALDIKGEFYINNGCITAFSTAAGIDCPEL